MNLVEMGISPKELSLSGHLHIGAQVQTRERSLRKGYNSLLDKLDFGKVFQSQKYEGSLNEILDQLERSLAERSSGGGATELVLHPPRIIRAVIDYKIANPEQDQESEMLLRNAIDLGLAIYGGNQTAGEQLKQFRTKIIELGLTDLLTDKLSQKSDMTTWYATHPERSKNTARRLAEIVKRKDILFIAFAHGGVAAGMDVYLRYCDSAGSDGSEFYAVRFSQYKSKDTKPRLTPSEMQYLQSLAVGREVVIFDEDVASGDTMDRAYAFFAGQVFPRQLIVTITNLDARAELQAKGLLKPLEGEHSRIKEIYENNILELNFLKNNLEDNNFKLINTLNLKA